MLKSTSSNNRLCIVCDTRKPAALFETKGEHIVPRSLGNRRLRTPHVCKACNGGLGGTVDVALKQVFDVSLACFDRGVAGTRGSGFSEQNADSDSIVWGVRETNPPDGRPWENHEVKGAILKIAYEGAHLRLGADWLRDPTAAALRNVLFAYVNKDREKARGLMGGIAVHDIPIGLFYFRMGKSKSEHIKRAIISKSCLNSLWLAPVKTLSGDTLAVVFDIEGLPPGYVTVSDADWGISAPELLAPNIK